MFIPKTDLMIRDIYNGHYPFMDIAHQVGHIEGITCVDYMLFVQSVIYFSLVIDYSVFGDGEFFEHIFTNKVETDMMLFCGRRCI